MPDILSQYYRGITQQLQAEVNFINSIFKHQGIKGEGNERILRDLITKFIPKKYGVGTGICVVDSQGNQSRQCDIVIYDSFLYPSLLSLSSIHLFPVDIVYATLEVKTTLTHDSSAEAIANIASVRKLKFINSEIPNNSSVMQTIQLMNSVMPHVPTYVQDQFRLDIPSPFYKTTSPLGFVFAYNSNAKQFQTFKDWFTPSEKDTFEEFPSFIGCLDQGLSLLKNHQGEMYTAPVSGTSFYEGHMIPIIQEKMGDQISFLELNSEEK